VESGSKHGCSSADNEKHALLDVDHVNLPSNMSNREERNYIDVIVLHKKKETRYYLNKNS
jgi:hypothetical protein